jgi:PAS domain S-box-containing protein
MTKRAWSFPQILLLSSIVITIAAVAVTVVITNTTLRSVEKNLPNTLFDELVALDLVLEQISDIVATAEVAAVNPAPENVHQLKNKVQTAYESIETLRQTYVFDNLIHASAFHAVVAPAVSDLQIWLLEGISGYGPLSRTTLQIVLSRISASYQKAKALNRQSRMTAKNQLDEERGRLDRFLNNVNLLFMLTLLITLFMVVLFIRQHLFKSREIKAQQALQTQSDLLNSLFENINLGIMVWNRDGLLLYTNGTFKRLTGYSLDDIKDIGTWFIKAYPDPDYRNLVFQDWQQATNLTEALREFTITCKNGRVKDIEFKGAFLPDGRSLITLTDITDRKLGEKRLHYFKTAVEYSSDAIGMADPTGKHWYQNRSFDDLFGKIGQDPPATVYLDEKVGRDVFKTIMEGKQWTGEVDMHGRKGDILSILLRAYAIKNEQNQIIGLVGTHTDMTRQKQAEKALLASEQKYRAVVENTPDLLYRTDVNGVITFISSSVYKLSGYAVEEAIGMKMAEEVYAVPEERQAFLDQLRKYGVIQNFQARLKKKDGSIWWAATNAHLYKDAEGNVMGVEGITRDITDTKLAEAALKESEQRMRGILEASPDPMVMYNRDRFPLYANPTFIEVFGWTMEELKSGLIPFIPDDQKKLNTEQIRKLFAHGKPVKFETKRLTKDGRILDILLSGAVTRGYNDQPTGMVVNLTDITERKALEAQYEQAQKMESLGTLAGGIAHDFNNLLGGIFGYLDIARKKVKDPKVAEYLNKAFSASERAEGLTHQLLTFSKGGAPVKKVEPLVPFLQESVQFALSGSNVSCRFDVPNDLWMCDYDKNQIGQVIDNIIINAKHAMPSGGSIQVTAVNTTLKENEQVGIKSGNYVKLSISDSGTGIPEKYISRIFDPFFTTKQTGSGLGLATSYSIVKKHDGIITVESELGVGTTFHVLIPASKHHATEPIPIHKELFKGYGNILIMDDDEMLLKVLVDMLEDMGFTALITTNGLQALEEFKKSKTQMTPFHAVILDLTIQGGMGGKETIREIRKLDKEIPVFVSSGYSEDDAIANPEEFGFTDSLKKPFGLEQLTRILKKYL